MLYLRDPATGQIITVDPQRQPTTECRRRGQRLLARTAGCSG